MPAMNPMLEIYGRCESCGGVNHPAHAALCVRPILDAAIGVAQTPREAQLMKWLALSVDHEQARVFAGLIDRAREEARSACQA